MFLQVCFFFLLIHSSLSFFVSRQAVFQDQHLRIDEPSLEGVVGCSTAWNGCRSFSPKLDLSTTAPKVIARLC